MWIDLLDDNVGWAVNGSNVVRCPLIYESLSRPILGVAHTMRSDWLQISKGTILLKCVVEICLGLH